MDETIEMYDAVTTDADHELEDLREDETIEGLRYEAERDLRETNLKRSIEY